MRKRILFSLFVLIPFLFIVLSPLAFATRSRLMGMGDLSIVIEDESNMINLWDFARNPAGLLEDEQGQVVRTHLSLDTYRAKWVSRTGEQLDEYHRYKPSGHHFKAFTSASLRRKGDFAVALNGNYVHRRTEEQTYLDELKYPIASAVFSKRVHSTSSVGGALSFARYESAWGKKEPRDPVVHKTSHFTGELGAARRFAEGVTLGALLGLDHVDSDEPAIRPDFYNYRMSLQCVVDVQEKLRLGLESALNLRTADFSNFRSGDESYYFTYFRLRCLYYLTSRLRVGLLFAQNELFGDLKYPLEILTYDTPLDGETMTHWGAGCSYKLWGRTLLGAECHFKHSSVLNGRHLYSSDQGLMFWSFNLGLETKPSSSLLLRGGYLLGATRWNPPDLAREQNFANENVLSLGVGYELISPYLLFEASYKYAFKRFRQWYWDWNMESPRHSLSLSVKVVL